MMTREMRDAITFEEIKEVIERRETRTIDKQMKGMWKAVNK